MNTVPNVIKFMVLFFVLAYGFFAAILAHQQQNYVVNTPASARPSIQRMMSAHVSKDKIAIILPKIGLDPLPAGFFVTQAEIVKGVPATKEPPVLYILGLASDAMTTPSMILIQASEPMGYTLAEVQNEMEHSTDQMFRTCTTEVVTQEFSGNSVVERRRTCPQLSGGMHHVHQFLFEHQGKVVMVSALGMNETQQDAHSLELVKMILAK